MHSATLRQDWFLSFPGHSVCLPYCFVLFFFFFSFAYLLLLFRKQNLSFSSSQGCVFSEINNWLSVYCLQIWGLWFQPVFVFSGICCYPMIKLYITRRETWYKALVHTACSHNKLITSLIGHDLSLAHKTVTMRSLSFNKQWKFYFYRSTGYKNLYTIIRY